MVADTKISALPAAGSIAAADLVPIVDVSDTSLAATGTDKKATLQALASVFDARWYGAKGDGQRLKNVTATSASPNLSFSAASFSPTDIGKACVVLNSNTGAGTPTTISAVTDATHIVLAANAGVTASGSSAFFLWASDDSVAINAALTAAAAYVSSDNSLGPNQPFSVGGPVVTVPHNGTGSFYGLTGQLSVPAGVKLDAQGMFVNLQVDVYNPAVLVAPWGSLGQLHMECCFATGIQMGTAAGTEAHCFADDIELWHVGLGTEGSGLLRSQNGVALLGYDHGIGHFWCKGGSRGIYHRDGSDAQIGRALCIGCLTGVYLQGSNQVSYSDLLLDSCGQNAGGTSGVVLDAGCSDISMNVQAFTVVGVSHKLDNVVLVGNGSTTNNVDLRFRIQAQVTGGVVLNLAKAQDVEADILASNTASSSSGGSNITTAIVFGTVAGSFKATAAMNGSITPYSGVVAGDYRYDRSGVGYRVQGGTAPTAAAQAANGTSPPAVTVTGNDQRGKISFGSGTTTAAGNQVLVTFNNATGWVAAPFVALTPANAATTALQPYIAAATATTFTVGFGVAPTASQTAGTYVLNYAIEG